MKSEFGLQFSPEPIDKPIFPDGCRIGGGERFGPFDTSIQTIEIREQEQVIAVGEAALFVTLEQSNGSVEIPAGQRSRQEVMPRVRWESIGVTGQSLGQIKPELVAVLDG